MIPPSTLSGMARLEGDDADYGPITDISAPYNYTSIFQKAIKVSGTTAGDHPARRPG